MLIKHQAPQLQTLPTSQQTLNWSMGTTAETNLEPSVTDEAATEDITMADPAEDQKEDRFYGKRTQRLSWLTLLHGC